MALARHLFPWSCDDQSTRGMHPARHLGRTVTISAREDGLLLSSANGTHALVAWGYGQSPRLASTLPPSTSSASCTVQGILGLLRGFSQDFVVAISKAQEAAASAPCLTRSGPIYSIQDVVVIPLEQEKAHQAILTYAGHQDSDDESSSGSEDADNNTLDVLASAPPVEIEAMSRSSKRSTVDILGAYVWLPFSKPPQLQQRKMKEEPTKSFHKLHRSLSSLSDAEIASRRILDSKIVRELTKELRHGMYFSYDSDVTHNTQAKLHLGLESLDGAPQDKPEAAKKESEAIERRPLPLKLTVSDPEHEPHLWQRSDPRFFWNRWLSRPFAEAKLHDFIYPIFQWVPLHCSANFTHLIGRGCVGQASVEIPIAPPSAGQTEPTSATLDLTIISRRSIERPGLRYQRRGINSEGSCANFVETELSASVKQGDICHSSSYVQTRGSIPLFWHQSPYALKPVPIMDRTSQDNAAAIKAHFDTQKQIYGPQTIVNLAEQSGKEAVVTSAYGKHVAEMADEHVRYVDFDFHKECKGMHYENISKLLDRLKPDIEGHGFLWYTNQEVLSQQNGVFRTNCMDCLDRTNVVQSALARQFLDLALARSGVCTETKPYELDQTFNALWAENGDAISKEYSGTSALKGDFTRTGKRNMRGVWNDATNSLARLFQGTVNDFFKQSMLDYVLGINVYSFTEFQESLSTIDPGELHRVAAIRQVAIDTCAAQLVPDDQKKLAGWTLMASRDGSTTSASGYEEKVLLLTNQFVYVVSYEYSLQKISSFVKIPLLCITSITHGTFIISTLSSFARDPIDNYGFTLNYQLAQGEGANEQQVESRENTYSMGTTKGASPGLLQSSLEAVLAALPRTDEKLVFKWMRKELGDRRADAEDVAYSSGQQAVLAITAAIQQAVRDAMGELTVERKDIRTLEEAQSETSYLAKLVHSIEHLIWL